MRGMLRAMESLFEEPRDGRSAPSQPLAARMRPTTLEEFVGQEHLLHDGSALRTAIEEGRPHSMVLFGPPGSGKTTLARIVAARSGAAFEEESAVQVGRAEVRAVLERAAHRRRLSGEGTIFFLDEIHRFNKAQQDALLPAVEEGLVTLIGATTENPYFEVNAALLSRTQVYELHALTPEQVRTLLERTGVDAEPPALEFLAERSGGDARVALSALEIAEEPVTLERAEDAMQRKALRYDKDADQHHDTISAWIKATRGSDPDASLYYLAIMLEGGEDPRFIARRMVILASEDIGNADPRALEIAVATAHAVEHVGLPECQFAVAQCAIYLSLAPKSNAAARAVWAARKHVADHGAALPPDHLRSAAYPAARKLGRGQGYEYPHDLPEKVSGQELLPSSVSDQRFYEPDDAESELAQRLEDLKKARKRAAGSEP
jgi:putative ATPase